MLRLTASAWLDGRVTRRDGRPVQSFALLVRRMLGALESVELRPRHVIHADGAFSVALPEGEAEVVVVAPGLAPSAAARVALLSGAPSRLEVTLDEGASVSGRVVDRVYRRPLPGARLSLEGSEAVGLAAQALVRTDVEGRFRLGGLPKGLHSVLVEADGHDARLTSVEVPAGGSVGPLELDLAPVADGGTPQLELVGIGAVLKAAGDQVLIDTLVPGGGAAEAGLVVGDVVVSIDGQRVSTLGFMGSIERIRGAEGSLVLLEVQRRGGALERVIVTRRRVVR
ncbi:MAG: carboxypeptidase regulatory-like domain-containing protein [Myxococcaceae bacterium]|nr:carboxypeptidase regulatory-like domain-containing protein [Myxococcaceae bacterium]